jgi:hypothetical protein
LLAVLLFTTAVGTALAVSRGPRRRGGRTILLGPKPARSRLDVVRVATLCSRADNKRLPHRIRSCHGFADVRR